MGIWSCLGTDTESVKDALYMGKSGIGLQPERLEYGYRSGLTGIVEQPKLKKLLDRRTRVGLAEEGEYAFMASQQAFQQAGVDEDYLLKNEVGVIFGNDSSAKPVIEASKIMEEKHDSAILGSGIHFPVDELNRKHEFEHGVPFEWCELQGECGLCKWESLHWSWV